MLARTKNKFNLKNGCTLCNMEKKNEIEKLNQNIALNKRNKLFRNCCNFTNCYFNNYKRIYLNSKFCIPSEKRKLNDAIIRF